MSVNVEKVGERIWLWSSRITPGLSRKIPGARFSKTDRPHWSLPLNLETCQLLRENFGGELEIGAELWAWAKAAKAGARRMAEIRMSGETVRLAGLWREDYPDLFKAVQEGRPYQALGAQWIASAAGGKGVLIGDTVGLGKTPQALAGVKESGVPGPHLVICPKTAVDSVWAPEIQRWLPGDIVITLPEGRAKREAVLDELLRTVTWPNNEEQASLARTWVVVHPEAIRAQSAWICRECGSQTPKTSKPKVLVCGHDKDRTKIQHNYTFPQLFQVRWGAVIADESDRSIVRLSGTPTQTRNGMELIRDEAMRSDGLRLAQSGTPFRSKPHLLWSTLNWLRPDEFTSLWAWAEQLFEVEEGYGGSRKIGRLRPDREAMMYATMDRIMLRRTREEVAPHLPAKMYLGTPLDANDPTSPVGVWLDMEPKQAKAYKDMLERSTAEIEGGSLSAIGVLAEMTRLQQLATSAGRMVDGEFTPDLPSNKYEYLLQMLTELGYPDDPQAKIVVVSRFTSVLAMFGRGLRVHFKGKDRTAFITGEVTGKRRQAAIDGINAPIGSGAHILLLNTKAGGSAITLDGADEMVFLDQTWIPDDQEQAEGRIDNRRPEEKIVQRRYRYLYSRGTIDAGIALVNQARGLTGHELMDGRRGIAYARQVLEKSR